MRTKTFKTIQDWMDARRGKIMGSKLKNVTPKKTGEGKKAAYYELIADLISLPPTDEKQVNIGRRLEKEAVARFSKETGLKVDTSLVIWEREENDGIAISPDGFIENTIAVEAKCLEPKKHIEAFLTQQIPKDYYEQSRQYFVVSDALQTLYMVFYCPLIPSKDYFVIEIHRKDIEEEITEFLKYEEEVLKDVKKIVSQLTF